MPRASSILGNPNLRSVRIQDFSGGLNNAVNATLVKPNELSVAQNLSFDEKGTAAKRQGSSKRYTTAFAAGRVAGMMPLYKKDGTTRLVQAVGGTLYSDTPHLITTYDTQTDWQKGTVDGHATTTRVAGDVQLDTTAATDQTQTTDTQAQWQAGTLSQTDAVTTPGDLMLAVQNPAQSQTRTTKADFDAGTKTQVDTAAVPDSVVLAKQGTDFTHVDTAQTDWQAGTADANIDLTSSPGDVKLVSSGTPWDHVDTSQTDWQAGSPDANIDLATTAGDVLLKKGRVYNPANAPAFKFQQTVNGYWSGVYFIPNVALTGLRVVFYQPTDITYINNVQLRRASDGYLLSSVSWVRGGRLTSYDFTGISLVAGTEYYVAVTSIDSGGAYADYIDDYGGSAAFPITSSDNTLKLTAGLAPLGTRESSTVYDIASLAGIDSNKYVSSGVWTSEVLDTGVGPLGSGTIKWTASLPANTGLTVEARTSADNSTWTAWSTMTNGGALPTWQRYVQYRMTLTSSDGANTPDVADVSLHYNAKYASSGVWTSEVLDARSVVARASGSISWTATVPANQTLTVEYRTSADNVTWSAWAAATNNGDLPWQGYVQYRLTLGSDGTNTPVVNDATLKYLTAYFASGTWESPVYDKGALSSTGALSWTAAVPAGTGLAAEYATSADNVTWSAWTSISSGGSIPGGTSNRYVKYRFTFTPTTDKLTSSRLDDVTISFPKQYFASGTWLSPILDLSGIVLGSSTISWTASLPANTALTVETRSSPDKATWTAWSAATSGSAIPTMDRYIQARLTLSATGEQTATPDVSILTMTVKQAGARGFWLSPAIDASQASDKTSGHASWQVDLPANTSLAVMSRSSADKVTWSAWVSVNADGSMAHPANNYVEVMAIITNSDNTSTPALRILTISFDGTPVASQLAAGFTDGGDWFGATWLDKLFMTDGLDAPQEWDAVNPVAAIGGSPPRGRFIALHKNRLAMFSSSTAPSRWWFSDLGNPESWPALNFIDVGADDGDIGSGMKPLGDALILTKRRSIWRLDGDSPDNYVLRRTIEGIGNLAPRSLEVVRNALAFAAQDGVYFYDGGLQVQLASDAIRPEWQALNHRRLDIAAAIAWQNKYYLAVPSAGSDRNDQVLVFDALRASWAVITGWNASCWTIFRQYQGDQLLWGDSTQGQVWTLSENYNDGGVPIDAVVTTKHFDFEGYEYLKRFHDVWLELATGPNPSSVDVSFLVGDGSGAIVESQVQTIQLPGGGGVVGRKVIPAALGAALGHSLAVKVRNNTLDQPLRLFGVTVNYLLKRARE